MLKTILIATTALTLAAGSAAAQTLQSQAATLTPSGQPRPATTQPTTGQPVQSLSGSRALQRGQAAQPGQARPLADGVARGTLERGDATLRSGEYADHWTFPVRRGETYELGLAGSGFDPYLLVRGPGGLSEDNDDDAARRGTRDSRIRFTAPADGEATASATSYQPGETGRYVLTLNGAVAQADRAAAPPPVARGDLRVGQTVSGRLAQGDHRLPSGEFAQIWTFQGRRGQALDLRLTSTAFDPYVMIVGPDDFSAYNDDDASRSGSRDSRLIATLPADGTYRIVATSYQSGESGAFQLAVLDGQGASAPEAPVRPSERPAGGGAIQIGQTVSGALAAGDETRDSGEYVDVYRFSGRRGQRVSVELTSSAFDAYTILRLPSGRLQDNDDSRDGGGTDSRLDAVLPEDGDYEVMVTSYRPGETGSYRFSVSPGQEPPRQATAPGGPRVYAVMVGVSDYAGEANNLPYTDEDARKLAETLRREGALNDASIVLTNAEATVGGVRQAFARVAAQAGPDDLFLFFFSGHGTQAGTPISGVEPDGKAESIVLRDGQISDTDMADLFETLNTRLSLLVLDSCFSGGFARNVVDRPGVMGLFSSEEDLTSAVAGKFRAGGYLSHFVRQGMAGEADVDGDRLVTAGELASYLRRQFRVEVEDVESTTQDGQRNYQNLVVDRGGVQVDDVIVRLPALTTADGGR
jgi:hypothetical protein